ncbi:ATP-grasp domain-containing protein [Clostridium tertium]|uniref:ATP-grasp domain-containing protein n=1 Tax=Clostridium tertium TaxID=1559 RepID=UPI00232B2C95|nr:ATP-grasp domain-containing protein [Clostridium tertium]MDB1921729.1 ATP-grasp domain-containing protein [Clostridium tertium]MDB1924932.1 ATP-grasp domain-containing protein [Clostridium tertium]MDB1929571.1 ATP-grasp domain-containing protein [Clostridium tertium]
MKKINILILSAGRRVELINCFKESAKKVGVESRIIAGDLSELAPAVYFSDEKYLIPRIGTENYIEKIIEICNLEDIALIIPTIDTELIVLSENKKLIEEKTNAKVLVSDKSSIDICRDKKKTNKFFEENGIGCAKEITEEDMREENYKFPLFIKPLDGSSSINTFKVKNKDELDFFLRYIDKPIVQEFIQGDEYTIDVFLDFESNPIAILPRVRLATRSGEILKGKVVKDEEIISEVKKILKNLKFIGHITIQCMKTINGIKFIEINPRFGGGAPIGIKAGVDSPYFLYKLLNNEKLEPVNEFIEDLIALRFDNAIFLKNGEVIND